MEPEPSLLASPCKAKSPEQPQRTVAEAMSAHDSGGREGLELRGLEHLGHGVGGDASLSAAECAQPAAVAATAVAVAGASSLSNGQADARRRSVCSVHGQSGGPTSMEDKCLECCVYYGVMCCQCNIL